MSTPGRDGDPNHDASRALLLTGTNISQRQALGTTSSSSMRLVRLSCRTSTRGNPQYRSASPRAGAPKRRRYCTARRVANHPGLSPIGEGPLSTNSPSSIRLSRVHSVDGLRIADSSVMPAKGSRSRGELYPFSREVSDVQLC
jgi:choline dehydrogenase-like flavoprotein